MRRQTGEKTGQTDTQSTSFIQLELAEITMLPDGNTNLLLEHVEVVDDDSDEEVEREEGSANDEDDEVKVVVQAGFPLGLLVHLPGVHRVGHDLHPALKRCLEIESHWIRKFKCKLRASALKLHVNLPLETEPSRRDRRDQR